MFDHPGSGGGVVHPPHFVRDVLAALLMSLRASGHSRFRTIFLVSWGCMVWQGMSHVGLKQVHLLTDRRRGDSDTGHLDPLETLLHTCAVDVCITMRIS